MSPDTWLHTWCPRHSEAALVLTWTHVAARSLGGGHGQLRQPPLELGGDQVVGVEGGAYHARQAGPPGP